jgi:UDP-N-acetylglucosamine 4,6-dehydratase/5-epimerase
MITTADSYTTVDLGKYYAILPISGQYSIEQYCKTMDAKPVEQGFCYNSGQNGSFLSVDELQALIRQHIDPQFAV